MNVFSRINYPFKAVESIYDRKYQVIISIKILVVFEFCPLGFSLFLNFSRMSKYYFYKKNRYNKIKRCNSRLYRNLSWKTGVKNY